MKNPFVMMSLMAAAMMQAFQEDRLRDAGKPTPFEGHSGRGSPGPRNPAGSKLIRKFYRAKHGVKADYDDSLAWYRSQK